MGRPLLKAGFGWLGCVLALSGAAQGCTLGFDTGSVTFDDERPGDGANGDAGTDSEVDLLLRREALGQICGINPTNFCFPESSDWEECAREPCLSLGTDARCVTLTSVIGHCTGSCKSDADCLGPEGDEFASTMRCVTNLNGQNGVCMPGSQQPCIDDASCTETPGEVCKLAQLPKGDALEVRTVCQTPTPRSAGAGALCNDDPRRNENGAVTRCANDFCVDDVCAAICNEQESDEGICGNENLRCADSALVPAQRGLCQPRACAAPSDCAALGEAEPFCSLVRDQASFSGPTPGVCRVDNPASQGSLGLGRRCADPNGERDSAACASRQCNGRAPVLYCSALCEDNDDCGVDQLCVVEATGVGFVKTCAYAEGSREPCDELRDGSPEDDNGRCPTTEACAPFLFGDISADGQQVENAVARGLCVRQAFDGAEQYESCEDIGCETPGACIRTEDNSVICTRVCDPAPFISNCEAPSADVFSEVAICVSVPILNAADNADANLDVELGFCIPVEL